MYESVDREAECGPQIHLIIFVSILRNNELDFLLASIEPETIVEKGKE